MSSFLRFLATLILLIVVFYGGTIFMYYFGLHDSRYDYITAFSIGYIYAVGEFLLNRKLVRVLR